MPPSKNDAAWEQLFERHNILEHVERRGAYEISAAKINELREARLMTKFDHKINLPSIFRQHDLTIQPNSRGTYLIGHFQSYQDLPTDPEGEIETLPFPPQIETINPTNLYSESAALLCAFNSGIIADVLEEDVALTVLGRMSAGEFKYFINDSRTGAQYEIGVENAQLEIDSGFEGQRTFAVIEAKNVSVEDFLIRQLYYPYRLWRGKTGKEVTPVFMTYSNDIFTFSVFRFTKDDYYNSIELVRQKRYQIGEFDIELGDIVRTLESVRVVPEPEGVPFPQADSFDRIIDLLTKLYGVNVMTSEEITTDQVFEPRQTQYYTSALRYLGLAQKEQDRDLGVTYSLNQRGSSIMARRPQQRNLALVERILEHRVFNETLRLYLLKQSARPTVEQVIEIMRKAKLGIEKESMLRRRAQTVLCWMDWIVSLTRR